MTSWLLVKCLSCGTIQETPASDYKLFYCVKCGEFKVIGKKD